MRTIADAPDLGTVLYAVSKQGEGWIATSAHNGQSFSGRAATRDGAITMLKSAILTLLGQRTEGGYAAQFEMVEV